MNKNSSSRAAIQRRADYLPNTLQEEFIVPLLKTAIESHLTNLELSSPKENRGILKVLDAGCGRQPFRHFFATPVFQYYSLDVQNHKDTHLDYVGALDAELPPELMAAGPYDFILCTEVLEHVADWDSAFSNLSHILALDGEILLTCPHFYPLHEQPHDYWRPTRHAIAHFAKLHGLEIHKFEALGSSWDILGTLLANQSLRACNSHYSTRLWTKVTRLARSVLIKLLTSRRLQSKVKDTNLLYISNFAILRRISSSDS